MATIEARLRALEERYSVEKLPRWFVKVIDSSIPDPDMPEAHALITDDDITGYSALGVSVDRLPGETLQALEDRCVVTAPKAVVWLAKYAKWGA